MALIAGTLAMAPSPIGAHGEAVESDPPPGAVLSAPPAAVSVTLSAAVGPQSTVEVLDADFRRVDDGATRFDPAAPGAMAVGVRPLAPGDYTVQWSAVDALDGHRTAGSFVFKVQAPGGAAGSAGSGAAGLSPARVGVLAAGLLVAGAVLLRAARHRGRPAGID